MAIDNISGEHYQVGAQSVDLAYNTCHHGGIIAPSADMKVANLGNAQPVEAFRQPLHRHFDMANICLPTAPKSSIPHTQEYNDCEGCADTRAYTAATSMPQHRQTRQGVYYHKKIFGYVHADICIKHPHRDS